MTVVVQVAIVCLLVAVVQSNPPPECAAVKCLAPECGTGDLFTPQGQCCPMCRGNTAKQCHVNGNKYDHGEQFMKDCNNCTCKDGFETCTEKACSEDNRCKTDKPDEVPHWMMTQGDPCAWCHCVDGGEYVCYYMYCLLRYCPNGYIRQGNECCPRCREGPCESDVIPLK